MSEIIKAWASHGGSDTVVLVHNEMLYLHTNIGWMGPVNHDGSTALEAAQGLAESWGLSECSERTSLHYAGIEPVGKLLADGRTDCCNAEPALDDGVMGCSCCGFELKEQADG